MVKCLVQHRADVQSVDGYGRTSLHWSCKVANVDVSVFLIEHGADVTAVDWGMRTPLHWVSCIRLNMSGVDAHHTETDPPPDKLF